jgi:hypothetical protein
LPCLGWSVTEQERNVKAGEYAGQSPGELSTEPEWRCEGHPLSGLRGQTASAARQPCLPLADRCHQEPLSWASIRPADGHSGWRTDGAGTGIELLALVADAWQIPGAGRVTGPGTPRGPSDGRGPGLMVPPMGGHDLQWIRLLSTGDAQVTPERRPARILQPSPDQQEPTAGR